MMEQIRRSHLAGIFQAVATCGAKHVCQELQSYHFYHRPLNLQKLIKNDFWFLDEGQVGCGYFLLLRKIKKT